MASRIAVAVVVLSIFLSGALPLSGTLCVGGHSGEDQHERVFQAMPAMPPVLGDGCCFMYSAGAEQVAVLQNVLPCGKSVQNESIIARAGTESLTRDQVTMTILSPTPPYTPPGMDPSSSILRI